MSFRKYGGTQFASSHNIVKSNVNTTDSFYVTQNVGQPNTYINFESDISGNMNIYGNLDVSGNLSVSGDIDCSGNVNITGNLITQADATINNLTVGRGNGNVGTNTAIGASSLSNNGNTGAYNTAIGNFALHFNTGTDNTAVGAGSMESSTSGGNNTAVGTNSLAYNSGGNFNTAVGAASLAYNGNTAAIYNTAIGYQSGKLLALNSSNNTFLGTNTDVTSSGSVYSNSTAVGYNAIIDQSNQMVLGGLGPTSSYPSIKIPGSYVGINGVYNPVSGYTLDVSGNVNATSYNSASDYRIKKDVFPLDEKFTVDKLRPVTYNNTKLEKQDIGLIAHELQKVYPFLVNGEKDGENLQSVNYTGLIGILIKEIQELKERVKKLEEK
jgi:hypothetical protein